MSPIHYLAESNQIHLNGIRSILTKPLHFRTIPSVIQSSLTNGTRTLIPNEEKITTEFVAEIQRQALPILLVEDNIINQTVALAILRKNGIEAESVYNGLEAIHALEQHEYALVLMDVQMPELDGLEATQLIRSEQSRVLNHQIPIIAMTANAMKSDQEKCLQAGMNDYIAKPFDPQDLLKKINRYLQSAELKPKEPAASPSTPSDEVIQFEHLCQRVMDDREMACDLLNKTIARIDTDILDIQAQINAADISQAKKLVHKLKGSTGLLSAIQLSKTCEELEKSLDTPDPIQLAAHMEAVVQAVQKFKATALRIIQQEGFAR